MWWWWNWDHIEGYYSNFGNNNNVKLMKNEWMKAGHSEVVSVFADKMLQLHTTRSWDFVEGKAGRLANHKFLHHRSSDVIIGVVDTGKLPNTLFVNYFIHF